MEKNHCKNVLKDIQNRIAGVLTRNLIINEKELYILYIPQITNRDSLSENIIKPLLQYNGRKIVTSELIVTSIIYIDDVFIEDDSSKLINYILEGKSVIIVSNEDKYLVANTLKVEKRDIQPPEIEQSLRAPKEAFNENLDSNLSLIRHRIKDSALKIDHYNVGRRTKTDVVVIYIEDIANEAFVKETKKNIEQIDVDGVLESGYVQKFLTQKDATLFSPIGISERADSACASILEGRVCILVDGSNLALISPKTFIEFLDSGDDHYDNTYMGIFLKILRFTSLIIGLTLTSLYVAIVAFHTEIIPSQYIMALATSRISVPVNAVTEALIMEFILEILREANIRLPKQIGSSVAIVGTIVIGQALVFAGLVSPLLVIMVSLSSMASYAVPDYTFMNPVRLLKFVMIFFTGVLGLFGFMMGLSIILIKIASVTVNEVSYTSTVSPFSFKDMKNYILSNVCMDKERPNYLNLKNKNRK